jgi:hypothetical protein
MADLSTYDDFVLSLSNARRIPEFESVYTMIQKALKIPMLFRDLLRDRYLLKTTYRKKNEAYTEYQQIENSVIRSIDNDRVFPLETVELQHYQNKHDAEISEVTIHTGPYADEYARSMNALAITVATDIYFRNNAYNPGTEEGRKTLAHELTHAAQYTEGRASGGNSIEELETEAEAAEQQECYEDNPYLVFTIGKGLCRIKKEEINSFVSRAADEMEEKIRGKGQQLSEEKYLGLLAAYEAWIEGAR